MAQVRNFIRHHFRHFNAASVVDAAAGWEQLLSKDGIMLLTMGGAMSTGEVGLVLAELIRRNKVQALCVTGANLEEDLFNLVAHSFYERIPHYRDLTPQDEKRLLERQMNRVTDTCIPEAEAVRRVDKAIFKQWQKAEANGERLAPHEYFYRVIESGELEQHYDIDPKDSWLVAACKKKLPIWVPGWEDSTVGNMCVGHWIQGDLKSTGMIKSGLEQMYDLVQWYCEHESKRPVGFFQIGGGITGDFPICVVPLIEQELRRKVKKWGYFCQISEAATSFGSYSGAPPNEKITWGKLDVDTPRFVIESDASIVFPLIAAYLLEM